MSNKKLIIINENEKETLKILLKKKVLFELIIIGTEKKGGINIKLGQKNLWSSLKKFNFPKQESIKLIKNLDKYQEFISMAYSMNYFTCKKYKLQNSTFNKYSAEIYLMASKFLSDNEFQEIIFLSPIDDYPILTFAMISSNYGKTKYLVRTGVKDKVYFSENFLYKGIKFTSNTKADLQKKISYKNLSDWNNYSKIMNSKSLNNLNQVDSNSKSTFKDKYHSIYDNWKRLKDLPSGGKMVYLPLHCDPGRTTQPEAGIFQNQLISIYIISNLLADDYQIIIKEHPRQFDNLEDFKFFRGNHFYEQVKKLKSVEMIRVDEDQSEIINKSSVLVTANGTSGWEALKCGKPVILFGHPWYSKCYGAININDLIRKPFILKKLIKDKNSIINSAEKLEKYILDNFPSYISLDRVLKFSKIKNNEKVFWEMLGFY